MGLKELIEKIVQVWHSEDKEKVTAQAEKVVEIFEDSVHLEGDQLPDKSTIARSAEILFHISDPIYGGLKGAPKFPVGYQYEFLLRYSKLTKDGRALFLVERSLDMMHRGGIYDHLGGGFSRYSVDDRWQIPHFEKMLYDNALLADIYTNAWKVTKKPLYRTVAMEICDYVLREMTDPEGGFYSAEDADSEGKEGLFYTWSEQEVQELLTPELFQLFKDFYGLKTEGNFEGRNILHAAQSIQEFAQRIHAIPDEVEIKLRQAKQILFAVREQRVHPFKDCKILTCWNGLMIQALANAGFAFNAPQYIQAACRAADFVQTFMWDRESLFRRYKDGDILHRAILDDYAFLIRGLITLFEVGAGARYLDFALKLTDEVRERFKSEEGAYFQSPKEEESLLIRKALYADGAEPSGNAVQAENLLRLALLTGREDLRKDAEDVLKSVKKFLDIQSAGFFYHSMNLMRLYDHNSALAIVALNDKADGKEELERVFAGHYIPHMTVVWLAPQDQLLRSILDKDVQPVSVQGKTTLYLCTQGSCQAPLTDLDKCIEAIERF